MTRTTADPSTSASETEERRRFYLEMIEFYLWAAEFFGRAKYVDIADALVDQIPESDSTEPE